METKVKRTRWFAALATVLAGILLLVLLPWMSGDAKASTEGIYEYSVTDDKVTIEYCDPGVSGDLTIPSTLGGYPVTSIGGEAFKGCSNLVSITIPEGVTSIGYAAFNGCSSLVSITIPESVTGIGSDAFNSCSRLVSITIPESVTDIGYGAFDGCSSLASISIPTGVTSIESDTFNGCSKLVSIIIPDGITHIGRAAFSDCSRLENITIPDGVTSIESETFKGCSRLVSITIPERVTEIGSGVFKGCSRLVSITIPESVTDIGYGAFDGCSRLASVSIPDGMTSIESSMFSGCSKLVSIIIPDGITHIGRAAFSGCSRLENITIPDGVTNIESETFKGCSRLVSITIPERVTEIGSYAFFNCSSLANIAIPGGVTDIYDYAFSGCSSLVHITIPKSVSWIGYSAFKNCLGLTDIYCLAEAQAVDWNDAWNANCTATVHWGELPPPTDMTAKALTAGGIKVSWTLSDGASKYNVYRKVAGGSWANIGYSRTNSYTDTTAEAGTLYYYRVRAQVSKTTSAYSANVSARWLATPAAPTLTNYTSGIKAVWSEVNGASIYYVWRAEGDGAFVKIGSSRTTSFVDKTAEASKTYRYAIKARYSNFYSQLGAETKTVRLETPAVTIKAYASGLKLTWETVPGATLYNIWRTSPGGGYEKIGTSRTLAYVDRTVESGVKYSYYVVAQVSKFISANSNIVSATAK